MCYLPIAARPRVVPHRGRRDFSVDESGVVMDARTRFIHALTAKAKAPIIQADRILADTAIVISASSTTVGLLAGQVLIYQVATLAKRLFDRVSIESDTDVESH